MNEYLDKSGWTRAELLASPGVAAGEKLKVMIAAVSQICSRTTPL